LLFTDGPVERCCISQRCSSAFDQLFQLRDVFCIPREQAPDLGYFSGGRSSLFNQPSALIAVSGSTAV
jgi:hypothetical protein